MNILTAAEHCGVSPKKVNPNEYASACPMCGGQDRFRMWPAGGKGEGGRWWCRQCRAKGDTVQLLMDAKGMDFVSAAKLAGKALQPQVKKYGKKKQTKAAEFIPRDYGTPAECWQACAIAFMERAVKELADHPEVQSYLAERGIPYEAACKFRLGYNPKDVYTSRVKWGLEETGKKFFIPKGLVIPAFEMSDTDRLQPYRLRIRRDEPGEYPRYHMLQGSNPQTYVMAPQGLKAGYGWVVVEAELDAIAIAAACGDYVGLLGLGSVAMKPPQEAVELFKSAGVILNALDYDEAGAKAHAWWVKTFAQTERHPVPECKDPGEYFKAGGDIGAWIDAGLPPACRREFLSTGSPSTSSGCTVAVEGAEPDTDPRFDGFLKIYKSYMEAHCDGFGSTILLGWAEINAKDLTVEEQKLRARVYAYKGKDFKIFRRAVIDYTNHIGDMATAYKAALANKKAEQMNLTGLTNSTATFGSE